MDYYEGLSLMENSEAASKIARFTDDDGVWFTLYRTAVKATPAPPHSEYFVACDGARSFEYVRDGTMFGESRNRFAFIWSRYVKTIYSYGPPRGTETHIYENVKMLIPAGLISSGEIICYGDSGGSTAEAAAMDCATRFTR